MTGSNQVLTIGAFLSHPLFTLVVGLILGVLLKDIFIRNRHKSQDKTTEFLEGSDLSKTYVLIKDGKEFILRFDTFKDQVMGQLSTDVQDDMNPYYGLVAHPKPTRRHVVKILLDAGFKLQ